ncbi:MAG: AtpZ/AtpI family protein [Eubacteriales bacterium]|nr:AtpZ/AtpI family protein [Eubacteriales bacterium]
MKNNFAKAFSLLSQVGINMIIPIILCVFIGKWIDEKLNTDPLFLIIFIILGVLSSFRNLYVLVIKDYKPETSEEILKNITEKEQDDDKNI